MQVTPARPSSQPSEQPTTALLDDSWRDADLLALPLPPAPPGERGYRPGDVARLIKLIAGEAPSPEELDNLRLSRTFFVGQGYHAGAVDALRAAWLDELRRRAL